MSASLTDSHRRYALSFLLVAFAVLSAVPRTVAEPPRRVEVEGTARQFLDRLAQAEKKHDYGPILRETDRQVAAQPENYEAYRRRALARWGARQYDGSLDDFQHALALADRQKAPGRVRAVLFYGRALVRREQHDTAAEAAELTQATRADGGFTDALNDLAWIRATHPDAALRNGKEAVRLARRACETVPDSVKYLDTLAAAYAEAGDAKRAVAAENDAVKAARADPRAEGQHREFLAGAQAQLDAYGRGEHHREDPRRAATTQGPAAIGPTS